MTVRRRGSGREMRAVWVTKWVCSPVDWRSPVKDLSEMDAIGVERVGVSVNSGAGREGFMRMK